MAKWWGRSTDERLSVGFSHGKTKGTETQGILVQQWQMDHFFGGCPALDVRLLLESWCATWEIMWNILPGIRSAWPTDFNFSISSPVTNRYIQCYKGTAMSCNVSRHPKPTPTLVQFVWFPFHFPSSPEVRTKARGKWRIFYRYLLYFLDVFLPPKVWNSYLRHFVTKMRLSSSLLESHDVPYNVGPSS